MANQVGGDTDFGADFARGASIANMRAMRQERMIQLQGQQALQAIQERHLAAQADALVYQLQQAKEEKAKQDNLLDTLDVTRQALVARGIPESDATKATDTALVNRDPGLAMKVGQARSMLAKPALEEAQTEMDKRRFTAESQFTPQVMQPMDVTTGKPAVDAEGNPLKMVTQGRGSAVQLNKQPNEISVLKDLMAEHANAVKSGDASSAAVWDAAIRKKNERTGFSLTTNPDGTFSLTQGPMGGPDELTKANQSKVQEQQAKALETVDTAERLKPLLTTETIGAEAFAKSWIDDRILAQRFPELASSKRAQASQLISQLRADAVKSFKSDGNISDRERNEILASFPKANDPVDSPARAQMVVQQTQTMAAVQALAAAKRLGGGIPKAAALVLDDENVAGMVKRGIIAPELAMKIWQMKRQ